MAKALLIVLRVAFAVALLAAVLQGTGLIVTRVPWAGQASLGLLVALLLWRWVGIARATQKGILQGPATTG